MARSCFFLHLAIEHGTDRLHGVDQAAGHFSIGGFQPLRSRGRAVQGFGKSCTVGAHPLYFGFDIAKLGFPLKAGVDSLFQHVQRTVQPFHPAVHAQTVLRPGAV